jgi:hypothetical protein
VIGLGSIGRVKSEVFVIIFCVKSLLDLEYLAWSSILQWIARGDGMCSCISIES